MAYLLRPFYDLSIPDNGNASLRLGVILRNRSAQFCFHIIDQRLRIKISDINLCCGACLRKAIIGIASAGNEINFSPASGLHDTKPAPRNSIAAAIIIFYSIPFMAQTSFFHQFFCCFRL